MQLTLGTDIGGTNTCTGVVDVSGKVIKKQVSRLGIM